MVGYMKYAYGVLALVCLSMNAYSIEFEKMEIKGYEKKIISETQIRYVKRTNPKKVIHLQVSQYNPENLWKEETIKDEISKMFETRKSMYKVFGFSDIEFYDYKLANTKTHPRLDIFGSYRKINDKKVYFSETNIYFEKKFLQVKIINEAQTDSGKIPKVEIDNVLVQIKAQELEVN